MRRVLAQNCAILFRGQATKPHLRSVQVQTRGFSTTETAEKPTSSEPANNNVQTDGEFVIDAFGRRLLKYEDSKGKRPSFYYDPETFDSYELLLTSRDKPKYATAWEDPNFPGWVQFMDWTGKRPFYMDRANPISQVTWAPPGEPDRDIFQEEYDKLRKPLTRVSDDLPGAPLHRRIGASLVDFGFSLGAGAGFGLLTYIDLGRPLDAAQGMGFATLIAYIMRDSVLERGTRSPGKRLLKLEIVTTDGQLPSRWNTASRQIYLPLYTGGMLLMPYIILLPIVDLGMVLFTKRSYRLGDLIGRTRVIEEQPDREFRFKEKCQRDDEDDARD